MSIGRAFIAGAGSLAMQLPYVSDRFDGDGYSNHWWWDNAAHLLGGYAVGRILAPLVGSRERTLKAFLIVTGAWEVFEYQSGERPWHTDENGNMRWAFDHAMEDTALDTVMGAAGAYWAASDYFGRDLL